MENNWRFYDEKSERYADNNGRLGSKEKTLTRDTYHKADFTNCKYKKRSTGNSLCILSGELVARILRQRACFLCRFVL